MNPYLKTSIKLAALTLWSTTLSVGVLLTYQQLRPALIQADLDALELKLHAALSEQGTQTQTQLEHLSSKLVSLESEVLELDEDLASLMGRQSNQEHALSELETQLGSAMNRQMRQLESRLEGKLSRLNASSSAPVEKKTRHVKAPSMVPVVSPPFMLYDVQKRGLTYLAIVGKPGATQLSELSALQAGQSYLQWRLVQVEPGRIALEKGQHRIEMEVRS
ncbi:hypothetical protein [Vibrio jasicida]|uniref:hypothetical protein n=1 Tax=Vibrio jasicida TaxID=766224 RepID=UPI0005F01FC0|nr:hypothetical protein [Vibrio jasicida]